MFKLYRRDPYFFLKYNLATLVVLGCASVFLYLNWSSLHQVRHGWILLLCILPLCLPNLWTILFSALSLVVVCFFLDFFTVSLLDLLLIPLGVIIGLQSAYLMHNAAHGSIKPGWLNRLTGELAGLQQLMGFPGWAVPHIIHHQHPDDPEKDPHPPEHLSFTQYLSHMGPSMARVARNFYFELWGDSATTRKTWKAMFWTSLLGRYLRAAFLLILLGPKIFVLCFIVSKVVNMLWYVHFNYYTHRPTDSGEMEVLNLDHNLYYRLMNATMAGVYYHKNHHMKASLFDPRNLDKNQDKQLISYSYPQSVDPA